MRSLSLTFILAMLALDAHAAPIRQPLEPSPEPEVFNFRDTWWQGRTYEGNNWIIELHADGTVTNTDGNNRYPKSGFWRANGNSLHFDLNAKYYDFRATLKGDELPGDSSNVTGLKWKTTFRRIAPMAVPPK